MTEAPIVYESRLRFGWLAGWLIIGLPLGCNTSSKPELPSSADAGSCRIDQEHQLGVVIYGAESPTRRFTVPVRNTTGSDVRFLSCQPSCACTEATLDKTELLSGEETALSLTFNFHGRSGPQTFLCQLVNSANIPWSCLLKVATYPSGQFVPSSIHFGSMDPNTQSTRDVELHIHTRERDNPPRVTEVRPDSDAVAVTSKRTGCDELPDGVFVHKTIWTLRLAPGATAHVGASSLVAAYQGQGQQETARLYLTWNVRNLYDVRPPRVFFGSREIRDGKLQREVVVRRADGEPIVIRGHRSPNEAVQVAVPTGVKAREHVVVVSLDPKATDNAWCGELCIETDHPAQPILKIPVAALGKQP